GIVVLASEAGLIKDGDAKVVFAGRLGPGRMMAVDLKEHKVLDDKEIKDSLGAQADYGAWCCEHLINLHDLDHDQTAAEHSTVPAEDKLALELAFGYDLDELEMILGPMAETGVEPTGSMGDDT